VVAEGIIRLAEPAHPFVGSDKRIIPKSLDGEVKLLAKKIANYQEA